jgi:hypothetical protein
LQDNKIGGKDKTMKYNTDKKIVRKRIKIIFLGRK